LRVVRRARVTVLETQRNIGGNVVEAAGVKNEGYHTDLIGDVAPNGVRVAPRVAPATVGRRARRDVRSACVGRRRSEP